MKISVELFLNDFLLLQLKLEENISKKKHLDFIKN